MPIEFIIMKEGHNTMENCSRVNNGFIRNLLTYLIPELKEGKWVLTPTSLSTGILTMFGISMFRDTTRISTECVNISLPLQNLSLFAPF